MNEIEKLYENAGLHKRSYIAVRFNDKIFTAEKQLNLIILLANREVRISPTYISSGYYLNNLKKIKSSRNISTFEDSLAQHINAIWQDLTEEEKEEIRSVLNG